MRLFMVPGMMHCGGGDGTADFDKTAPIERWVEKGEAPDQIIAAHIVNGKPVRTRLLCPYPQVAQYKGSGSTDEAGELCLQGAGCLSGASANALRPSAIIVDC